MHKTFRNANAFKSMLKRLADDCHSLQAVGDLYVSGVTACVLPTNLFCFFDAVVLGSEAACHDKREPALVAQVIQCQNKLWLNAVFAGFTARKVLDFKVSKFHKAPEGGCLLSPGGGIAG
jgi:hypothetical protein